MKMGRNPMMIVIGALLVLSGTVLARPNVSGTAINFESVKDCRPADIIFVLDESNSIWRDHFKVQLDFVQNIVKAFHISPTSTRVGLMTFATWPHLEFHLNAHNNAKTLHEAIGNVKQSGGSTHIADALDFMRRNMFSRARPNVVKIGIVITDGDSGEIEKTAAAAKKVKDEGILLFAIGVGKAYNPKELRVIASNPHESFTFEVTNFSLLDGIENVLATKTCKGSPTTLKRVTAPPTTTPRPTTTPMPTTSESTTPEPTTPEPTTPEPTTPEPTTPEPTTPEPTTPEPTTPEPTTPEVTTERMMGDEGCGLRRPADVMFILPEDSSSSDSNKGLDFLISLTEGFEIGDDQVRLGLVPQHCNAIQGVALDDFDTKGSLLDKVKHMKKKTGAIASQLKYMRTRSFTPCNGARDMSKKIGVIVLDTKPADMDQVRKEASHAKEDGVELFVITIGKEITDEEAQELASPNRQEHHLAVTDYTELPLVQKILSSRMHASCAGSTI